MANVEIIPIPIGSQFVRTIGSNDPDSLNDFPCLLVFDENVTGLGQSGVSVSSGSSILSIEGEGSVYRVWVRPPQTAGIVTLTIARNAVNEGNPQTRQNIRVSTSFPDADAEVVAELFNVATSSAKGLAVSPMRVYVSGDNNIYSSNHDGTEITGERISIRDPDFLSYFNESLLVSSVFTFRSPQPARRVTLDGSLLYNLGIEKTSPIVATRLGFLSGRTTSELGILPYGKTAAADVIKVSKGDFTFSTVVAIAHQNGYIYGASTSSIVQMGYLTDNYTIENVRHLNINANPSGSTVAGDIAIYQDTFYVLRDVGSTGQVHTLDIRKYRPLAQNTKTRIDVQIVREGDTIPLTQFCPDAERVVWDVGFDKPSFLSVNANSELSVGSVSNDSTVLVKLKGINRIDATADGSFQFYLVILKAQDPVWRDVAELTMPAGSSYDLHQLVDADAIEFRSGRTRLAGSRLSNGVFMVGTEGGLAEFTARKAGRSSHIAININLISSETATTEATGYRVEIMGINVTADVLEFPSVSETLDPVIINEYVVNQASVLLENDNGKYNPDLAGNFWAENGLNRGGFENGVKIYTEHVDGSRNLLFAGRIIESFEPFSEATFQLNCADVSSLLRNARVQNFGTLEKWDVLRRQSDEENGVYAPDRALPMQPETVRVWADRTELTLSRLELPSEGPVQENTAYASRSDVRTAGGYLPENPIAQFKTQHRSEDIRFLVNQLAVNKGVYNVQLDIPGVTLDDPFILNRGSIPFSVENTRVMRLPVDWVHDPSNRRILILLSNPEGHVADRLVQYDLNSDSHRVLYEFDKDLVTHRIVRRNSTNYYILTSKPISQDRSASTLPRASDSTGYAYDSVAAVSEIKIYHYNASTGTLTEHVAEDNARPPQLGIHIQAGFENSLYIDDFEGIVPDYRGPLKVVSSDLYYRYAKDGEFGVARVNTARTTERLIHETSIAQWNHLNFAFDVTSTGTIHFVYATRDSNSTSLIIKRRTSDGTVTTLLTERRNIGDFLTEDTVDFGGFLGCYEALFHNNYLYMLCPIQKIESVEDLTSPVATPLTDVINIGTGGSGRDAGRIEGTPTVTNSPLALGADIVVRFSVRNAATPGSGLNFNVDQSEFTITNGTLISARRFSSSITLTIRPTDPSRHQNIGIGVRLMWAGNPTLENGYILIDFGIDLSRSKSAGMALYRCNVTAAHPSLEILETYDFVQLGACNLVVHEGSVHFVEHPPAGTRFRPINPDLDGYWTDADRMRTMGYNLLPENQGQLKRVSSSGAVESLGNLWYTDRPYNVAATRCLSIDGDLHLTMGYGNLDEILRFNSLASAADNLAHLVYGRTLHYVLPEFDPQGSVYEALADIAKKVNATLSFEKNIIMITDRSPYRAETDGTTGTGTGNLNFTDAKKSFPSMEYLLIGKEILQYLDISGNSFTGIMRGVLGSAIVDHPDGSEILYLDTLIRSSDMKAVTLQSDTNRIFNVIRDAGGIAEVRDAASIAKYGERPYTLNLGLTRHEKAWTERILQSYLEEFKDLQQLVNLQTVPDTSLKLGRIVPFFYEGLMYGMRIVGVQYEDETTHIRGRTV